MSKQGRIKIGTWIFQDYHWGSWPTCLPPKSEYEGEEYQYEAKNPDMLFDITPLRNGGWDCRADGYGQRDYLKNRGDPGEYGNGSIFVRELDGVELEEDE